MKNRKMCYIIHCHKNAQQVNMLIEALNTENVDFIINVDKKSNIYNELLRLKNIFFVNNRRDIKWGTNEQVKAILDSFKYAINLNEDYSYIHLLSGQDFPIKSNEYIYEFFKNNDKQYIYSEKLPKKDWERGGLNRVEIYYPKFLIKRKSMLLKVYLKLIKALHISRNIDILPDLYGGSSWFSITKECCEYIVNFIDNNSKIIKFFENVICGDELIFQTIIMNSKYKNYVISDSLRYIKWQQGNCSPDLIDEDDIDDIKKSKKIFARKFDIDKNNVLYKVKDYISTK